MAGKSHYSKTYAEARRRFVDAARLVGASVHSYRIRVDGDEELSIDVAIQGPDDAPTIVTSSGVHGVEGYFGSAVQLSLLERWRTYGCDNETRHVLIHAVNPFGFSHLRRFNEENIDLNRNFLLPGDAYSGSPDGYARLNPFLNPRSPPSSIELFKLKTIWNIGRYGLASLKQSVAGGQYEFPDGIFYGGDGTSESMNIIAENCDNWIGSAQKIVHIDFHSGLGAFGSYKLLLADDDASDNCRWCGDVFGSCQVEPLATPGGTAYKVSGLFGAWMQHHFASRAYRFVGAEFGTYDVIRVLGAIRNENRAHHYGEAGSGRYIAAKKELFECFCPCSDMWRQQVLESSLKIIDQAEHGLHHIV